MKKLKLEELGRLSLEEFRATPRLPVCLVLDNVRSLHNVGSAFRTGDAFAVERIILSGITGKPPHREIQKTALGATESVPWEHHLDVQSVVSDLKARGYRIVLIEQTTSSMALQDFVPEGGQKYALVFGNEVDGVTESLLPLADVAVEVPQAGTKHSLNVSVCMGVVLWELYRKIKAL